MYMGTQLYCSSHRKILENKAVVMHDFPTIFTAVFVKEIGRYMTNLLAVKATYNRLYVVFTNEMLAK